MSGNAVSGCPRTVAQSTHRTYIDIFFLPLLFSRRSRESDQLFIAELWALNCKIILIYRRTLSGFERSVRTNRQRFESWFIYFFYHLLPIVPQRKFEQYI